MRWRLALALFAFLLAAPAWAVLPDEVLDDPVLEARARTLSAGLRCLVCQNQSIDDSNAELARDLRLLVRERLTLGDTNAEVLQFMVDRYGEFVLLNPRLSSATIALWVAPPILLVFGGIVVFRLFRSRSRTAEASLSKEEEARLVRLMAVDAEE